MRSLTARTFAGVGVKAIEQLKKTPDIYTFPRLDDEQLLEIVGNALEFHPALGPEDGYRQARDQAPRGTLPAC